MGFLKSARRNDSTEIFKVNIFQKLILFHLFHCQLSPIFLHQIQRSGTDARHEDSKTVIDY